MRKKHVVWVVTLVLLISVLAMVPWQLVTHKQSVIRVEAPGFFRQARVSCTLLSSPRWDWVESEMRIEIHWNIDGSRELTTIVSWRDRYKKTFRTEYGGDGSVMSQWKDTAPAFKRPSGWTSSLLKPPYSHALTAGQVERTFEKGRARVEEAARNGKIQLPEWWPIASTRRE